MVLYNRFIKYFFDVGCFCVLCDLYINIVILFNILLIILLEVFKIYFGLLVIFSIIFVCFKEEFFKIIIVDELLWGYRDVVFEFFVEIKCKYCLFFFLDIDFIFEMMDNNILDGVMIIYIGVFDISCVVVWIVWKGRFNVGLWNLFCVNMFNGSDGM